MKIGKIKRKVIKPDVIPVTLPTPKPIPAPDIFKPIPISFPRPPALQAIGGQANVKKTHRQPHK